MGEIGRDPVCGMLVDSEKAADSLEFKGKTYQFCSIACAEKFEQDPEQYAGKTAGGELNNPPAA
jgi:Cu+-exporting ATPase